jgi:hypothetical protein
MKINEIINDFFPNGLDTLADIIGPQGNLLEKLEIFNNKWMAPDRIEPLKVTKTWRWGNGTYDRIKDVYARKVMMWHKRPRGMKTLFDRKRAWFENEMQRELLDIEKYLINSRNNGSVWLDKDTDDGYIEQYIYEFCKKFNYLEDILQQHSSRYNISQITYHDSVRNRYNPSGEGSQAHQIVPGIVFITFLMHEKPIKVTKDEELICEVPFPPIEVKIKIDINKWISTLMIPATVRDRGFYNTNSYTKFFEMSLNYMVPKKDYLNPKRVSEIELSESWYYGKNPIQHPFIQKMDRQNVDFWYWRNYCWGSFGSQILTSFCNMDFDAFFIHMDRWLYNYELIGANPLNNITKSMLGVTPEFESKGEYILDSIGYNTIDCHDTICRMFSDDDYPIIELHKAQDYCDIVSECVLKDQCKGYNLDKHILEVSEYVYELSKNDRKNKTMLTEHQMYSLHSNILRKYNCFHDRYTRHLVLYGGEMLTEMLDLSNYRMEVSTGLSLTTHESQLLSYLLFNRHYKSYAYIITLSIMIYIKEDILNRTKWNTMFEVTLRSVYRDIIYRLKSIDNTPVENKIKNETQEAMASWVQSIRNN